MEDINSCAPTVFAEQLTASHRRELVNGAGLPGIIIFM